MRPADPDCPACQSSPPNSDIPSPQPYSTLRASHSPLSQLPTPHTSPSIPHTSIPPPHSTHPSHSSQIPPQGVPWTETSFYGVGVPYRYMLPPPHIITMPHHPLPDVNSEKVAKAFMLSRFIRIFAFVDALFLLLFGLFQMYYFFPGIIFAFCGYCGARGYNKFLTSLYGFYLLVVAGLRIYFAVVYFTLSATAPIVITALGVAVDIYVGFLIFSFLYLLSQFNAREKESLLFMEEPPLLYTFYQPWGAQPIYTPLAEPLRPSYGTGGDPGGMPRNVPVTGADPYGAPDASQRTSSS